MTTKTRNQTITNNHTKIEIVMEQVSLRRSLYYIKVFQVADQKQVEIY